ncbi:hypothetical protein EON70_00780 [bacterium]|nr:MAG: hypothetical protein EON70_00780 [bacterium]
MIISKHRPQTQKPESEWAFSFFLAGLIDSDGHFSKIPQLVISFHEKEMHIPYYLKKKIGYGIVSKVKKKRATKFVIAHRLGLEKVCALVRNKLRHQDKIAQYNTRLSSLPNFESTENNPLPLRENAWFSGFFSGDGCFQIVIVKREGRKNPSVGVVAKIDQKTQNLLLQIKNEFGGSLGFRASQNTFYYSCTSYDSITKCIQYFDRFHLMGVKQTQYVIWRKVFLKIQDKNYKFTEPHLKWISSVKKRMQSLGQ